MNDQNMKQWLEGLEKGSMTANDDLRLDELLSAPSQQLVKNAVANLPEYTVNLQWRSKLNERIGAMAPIKRRISYALVGARALAGLGIACLVMVAYLGKAPSSGRAGTSRAPSTDLAVALLTEHRQSVASSEIAVTGIADGESDKSAVSSNSPSWKETDLETL